jgi:hypothetical protein
MTFPAVLSLGDREDGRADVLPGRRRTRPVCAPFPAPLAGDPGQPHRTTRGFAAVRAARAPSGGVR